MDEPVTGAKGQNDSSDESKIPEEPRKDLDELFKKFCSINQGAKLVPREEMNKQILKLAEEMQQNIVVQIPSNYCAPLGPTCMSKAG